MIFTTIEECMAKKERHYMANSDETHSAKMKLVMDAEGSHSKGGTASSFDTQEKNDLAQWTNATNSRSYRPATQEEDALYTGP